MKTPLSPNSFFFNKVALHLGHKAQNFGRGWSEAVVTAVMAEPVEVYENVAFGDITASFILLSGKLIYATSPDLGGEFEAEEEEVFECLFPEAQNKNYEEVQSNIFSEVDSFVVELPSLIAEEAQKAECLRGVHLKNGTVNAWVAIFANKLYAVTNNGDDPNTRKIYQLGTSMSDHRFYDSRA